MLLDIAIARSLTLLVVPAIVAIIRIVASMVSIGGFFLISSLSIKGIYPNALSYAIFASSAGTLFAYNPSILCHAHSDPNLCEVTVFCLVGQTEHHSDRRNGDHRTYKLHLLRLGMT